MKLNGTPVGDIDERISRMAHNSMKDHAKRGFEVKIFQSKLEEKIWEGFLLGCAFCGQKMVLNENGKNGPNSISIDVINPEERTFSGENIQIVCSRCNSMKGQMSRDEFIEHCDGVVQHVKDTEED